MPDTTGIMHEHITDLLAAKQARLAALWRMTPTERLAAMRRSELTYEQLAAWSARHPDQIPRIGNEFEWIAVKTPEFCGD